MTYFIGLNSGTSMDSIDAAIVEFEDMGHTVHLKHALNYPIPERLKAQSQALSENGQVTLQCFGELDNQWGALFAEAANQLIADATLSPQVIKAIGCHGQTLWHAPQSEYAFTLQIGDPNIIAKRTQITTIADFRRGDMALGGQGAPLAAIFHHWLFSGNQPRILLNIGGIANITVLEGKSNQPPKGFDTGPGNGLLDSWTQFALNQPFDLNGTTAQGGQIIAPLLAQFLADPYFKKSPPKTTGKDYFNLKWIQQKLGTAHYENQDILCTLTQLTAQTIANDIQKVLPKAEVIVCGGGADNRFLMKTLKECLGENYSLGTTTLYGIPPGWVEACLFAWLAKQRLMEIPLDLTAITGVRKQCTLGGGLFRPLEVLAFHRIKKMPDLLDD